MWIFARKTQWFSVIFYSPCQTFLMWFFWRYQIIISFTCQYFDFGFLCTFSRSQNNNCRLRCFCLKTVVTFGYYYFISKMLLKLAVHVCIWLILITPIVASKFSRNEVVFIPSFFQQVRGATQLRVNHLNI